MANKSSQPRNSKKPGRTLKEKRLAKHAKQEANRVARQARDR